MNSISRRIYLTWNHLPYVFNSSKDYWIERYRFGGNSGNGSCGRLAQFKANVLNRFITKENITTVIDFGCGDGNQLKLCQFPSYLGFDVSPDAISSCKKIFSEDDTKEFKMIDKYNGETAELSLSLDVIYHLIEDRVFNSYMSRLFNSSEKYVIIYSSNMDSNSVIEGAHVRHRKFTRWVEWQKPQWRLREFIPNKYPLNGNKKTGSLADFFIYQKVSL